MNPLSKGHSPVSPSNLCVRERFLGPVETAYFPSASLTPKPTSIVPAMRLSQTVTRGLARMRSAAKWVINVTVRQ